MAQPPAGGEAPAVADSTTPPAPAFSTPSRDTTSPPPPAFSTPSRDSSGAHAETSAAPDTSAPGDTTTESDSTAAAEPTVIGSIRVEGNTRTEADRIIRSFEVSPGNNVSREQLRRGLRKLYTLGLFTDVWIEEIPRGEQLDLIIHVHERPRLASIVFSGNQKRETSELEKKLMVRPGEILTPNLIQSQVDSLMRYYHEEGYAQASIGATADTNQTKNEVTLQIQVHEGEKVRIQHIDFVGVKAFPPDRLRKALSTKQRGWFGGGELKEEKLSEDQAKLENFYKSHGYRDAQVLSHEVRAGPKSKDLTLVYTIEEGRLYWFGKVQWAGNHAVDNITIRRMWTARMGDHYDLSKIDKAKIGAYSEYAEHGYLIVEIEPEETVRDSLVDITFNVREGQPSKVRYVNILANKGTREKVIRREIDLHEGDLFQQSKLRRTHDDIMRLGIFEEIGVDFSPADSSDVDINLRVKEKQVGTASAGAGYTGDTGITGFLELGHNNVLGNGQSLSLHLERGGRRSNYYLSFTEPWFRDTPTLLGFSLFNTRNAYDLYDQKSAGASVRIGRPLAWPDFSRGSIAYRLENVTIDNADPSIIPTLGQEVGKPVLTSLIETTFSRNNQNHPFYPTHGTRLDLIDQFAGGPFGGSVNFNKHRWDGRVYMPSIVRGLTTMVRARVGILAQYPDQHLEVPTSERFRLGGGSTMDPLRGYDDYQVVPKKFIHDVITIARVITGIDSTTTPGVYDTTYREVTSKQRVRYPGGKFMSVYTIEQQFPIVVPLRGVLFFDAGNTWDQWSEIKPYDLRMGAGFGLRMEIPLLGNVGLDYGYGFNRDDGPRPKAHFLLGNFNF